MKESTNLAGGVPFCELVLSRVSPPKSWVSAASLGRSLLGHGASIGWYLCWQVSRFSFQPCLEHSVQHGVPLAGMGFHC